MNRYRKILIVLLIIDMLVIAGMFLVSKKDKADSGDDKSRISLAMEEGALPAASKNDIFDGGIYSRKVIPSGEPMGIYMKTDGVLVVDICSFVGEDGQSCSPSSGVLEKGDYVTSVNGQKISRRSELLRAVSASGGKTLNIVYVRNEKEYKAAIRPGKNENGSYLLGAWVKDDVSGIGTVTFIDGVNFMALGHSVSDVDTGLTMRCSTGGVYTTDITGISKSYISEPGKLQGSISYKQALVGIIDGNSESGIYGHLGSSYCEAEYGGAERMYIAHGSEAAEGGAYIYSRMTGELKKYEIDIESISGDTPDKNIEFEVTDDELLKLTGGVVQGMSGSPIVQNGKIIGAVTHVFVDDPTRGYGIFIERMLD